MRVVRAISVAFLATVLLVVPAHAFGQYKPRCAVPKGWRVVAKDQVALVVRGQGVGPDGTGAPAWRYCTRSSGRFRPLVQESDMGGVGDHEFPDAVIGVKLAGRYVSYAGSGEYRGENLIWWVVIVDTKTNRRTRSADGQEGGLTSPLLLSTTGSAAWIWAVSTSPGTLTGEVRVLGSGGREALLDSASVVGSSPVSDSLRNLQLYGCVDGCGSSTGVVGWTHSGTWRYAQISN